MYLTSRKMFIVKLLVLVLVFGPVEQVRQVTCFWFTDTSLFQPPPIQINAVSSAQAARISQLKSSSATLETDTTQVKQQQQPTIDNKMPLESNDILVATKNDQLLPWLRLEPKQFQQQELQLQELQQQQQQQCQCNLDWLQNQTSSWLNKWLSSPNVASQMRLLMLSNSTGTTTNTNTNRRDRDAKLHHDHSNGNNHWTAWIRAAKGNNGQVASSSSSSTNNNSGGINGSRPVSLSGSRERKAAHSQQQQQQRQMQLKLVQGERGPQGPKGEMGARGERGEVGPSGLISVKDRDSLFDLLGQGLPGAAAATKSSQNSDNNNSNSNVKQTSVERRLVFIESEQMLVVGTDLGWRPVQLLPVLRDFRKTIAKFSLSSPEERRRLMLGENMDNSIKPPASSLLSSSNGANRVAGGGTSSSFEDNDDDADADVDIDVDGNQLEEDDDEDDDDDDDEDDDNDNDDVDGGDAISEEDAQDEDADTGVGGGGGKRRGNDGDRKGRLGKKQRPGNSSGRMAQTSLVSARSATGNALIAAPALDTSIDNSITTISPTQTTTLELHSKSMQGKHQTHAGGRPSAGVLSDGRQSLNRDADHRVIMKLRIAALNEPFSGNVHGIRGADFECKRNAARANVKGSFRAFLASGFQNLNEVVRQNVHKYPIVNLRGETLANSWHDLFKQPARTLNPLSKIYSFDGRHVATDSNWPNKLVWHGATNKAGYRDLVYNCDGWHSDSLNKLGYATPLHPPRGTTNGKKPKRKRNLAELKQSSSQNSTQSLADHQPGGGSTQAQHNSMAILEVIEKYPCRMPLIVLCIETIGQHQQGDSTKAKSSPIMSVSFDNNDMAEINNMVT